MAEGLARKILGTQHPVQSAGSQPGRVNPFAIQALKEIGIDISGHTSKSVATIDLKQVDRVITLCHDEVCPVLPPGLQRLHWPIPDPAGQGKTDEERLGHFRIARDALQVKIETFAAEFQSRAPKS